MRSFLLSPTTIILSLLLVALALHQLRAQAPQAGAMLRRAATVERTPAPEPVPAAAPMSPRESRSPERSTLMAFAMAALTLAAATLAARALQVA